MYQAILNDKIISSMDFYHKYPNYKQKNIFATCPVCDGELFLYGCSSLLNNINCRFHHFNNNTCIWPSKILSAKFPPSKNIDKNYGIALKNDFLQIENLKQTLSILKNIVGEYIVTIDTLKWLYYEANRRNLWNYVGL